MAATPIYGVNDWAAAQASPWTYHNEALRLHEAIMRGSVADRDLTAPPATCAAGAAYLVKATATGAWTGKGGLMAVAVGTNAASGWLFANVATEGFLLYVEDESALLQYVSGAWTEFGGTSTTQEWAPNFTAAADMYIPATVAMTIGQGNAKIGTGTLAYAKSTNAAPSTFASTTLPATLEAGAWLKVTASAVTGFVATHLVRTA